MVQHTEIEGKSQPITAAELRAQNKRTLDTMEGFDPLDWRNAPVRRALFNLAEAQAAAAEELERAR